MVRALSFHASYQCRHRGACCTAGWPIAIEADRVEAARAAIARGALIAPAPFGRGPTGETLLPIVRGRCGFHDERAGRCAIQRALGHEALPIACRQFPRVSVRDPRGVSITLSHYCPTAASLLESNAGVTITDAPPAFPPAGEYEGLDAREMPPLLRPEVAMDWESWWEFERRAVDLIAGAPSVPAAFRGLRAAIETIRPWHPGTGRLFNRVTSAFDDVGEASGKRVESRTLRHYTCAHAFANWTVHLGLGLRTWLRSIEVAYRLARRVGVRQADLHLRHLTDPRELARRWSRIESTAPTRPTFPTRSTLPTRSILLP